MVDQQNRDISAAQGTLITVEAATWSSTKYVSIGEASSKGVGGDCSGSIFRIYAAAGFPYDYRRTEDFPAYALRSGISANSPPATSRRMATSYCGTATCPFI